MERGKDGVRMGVILFCLKVKKVSIEFLLFFIFEEMGKGVMLRLGKGVIE